jgi:hypothetical protein
MISVRVLNLMAGDGRVGRPLAGGVEGSNLAVENGAVEVAWRTQGIAEPRGEEAAVIEGNAVPGPQPPFSEIESGSGGIALERVIEVAAAGGPIDEANGQLVSGTAMGHPVFFLELQEVEEELDGAESRFADSDRSDIGRINDGDALDVAQGLDEVGGSHPTGGAAAKDDDTIRHGTLP